MPLLAGCAQVAGRYRRYGEKLALCQHAGGSRSSASYDQVCADVQRGLRTTTWRVAPLSRVGLHAEPAPPRQSQSPVQLVRDQLPRMLAAVVGMVPGGQPTAQGCACEDAPRTTEPTEERQRRGRRFGPRAAKGRREGAPKSGGPQRRSTRSPGELLLRPYGPPGRRSCGLPVRLPHSWRTWAAWMIRHIPVNRACVPNPIARSAKLH
jgi:hypothetical protein